MSFPRWGVVVMVASTAVPAQAQTPTSVVWQVHALGTTADDEFVGVGLGLGRRPGSRIAYSMSVTPGVADRKFGVRSEGLMVFSLDPARRAGAVPYGGGGIAVQFNQNSTDAFLVLLIGVESAPATRSGWFAEIGLGGGLRGAVGWRLRK